jgi:hypothetical protein
VGEKLDLNLSRRSLYRADMAHVVHHPRQRAPETIMQLLPRVRGVDRPVEFASGSSEMAPKKQNKKRQKKREERFFKVENLKDRLQSRGEHRVVDERMLSCSRVLSKIKSTSELDSLFARKPRSVVWISDYVYMYKRSLLRSSCDLLTLLDEMNGVQFRVLTSGDAGNEEEYFFELHWNDSGRNNFEVTSSVGSFVRVLARDGTVETIGWRNLRPGFVCLPIEPQALATFFSAASPRKFTFTGIIFTKNQCSALFSRKHGSVVVQEFDMGVSTLDQGASMCNVLKKNVGINELHLTKVHQSAEKTFQYVMRGLHKNRLVHSLSITQSTHLSDGHMKALCVALRRSKYLKQLVLRGCMLTRVQWKNLWASIKVNKSIVTIDICRTLHGSNWYVREERDADVDDALRGNQTLEVICHTPKDHLANFWERIHPCLVKNRIRARAQNVAVEPCQGKRWALLGNALCHSYVRNNPGVMFTFLKTNLDSVVTNAPKGKELLVRQLEKLDVQRTVVLDKLHEYEESEKRAYRKRQAPGILEWIRKKARN